MDSTGLERIEKRNADPFTTHEIGQSGEREPDYESVCDYAEWAHSEAVPLLVAAVRERDAEIARLTMERGEIATAHGAAVTILQAELTALKARLAETDAAINLVLAANESAAVRLMEQRARLSRLEKAAETLAGIVEEVLPSVQNIPALAETNDGRPNDYAGFCRKSLDAYNAALDGKDGDE